MTVSDSVFNLYYDITRRRTLVMATEKTALKASENDSKLSSRSNGQAWYCIGERAGLGHFDSRCCIVRQLAKHFPSFCGTTTGHLGAQRRSEARGVGVEQGALPVDVQKKVRARGRTDRAGEAAVGGNTPLSRCNISVRGLGIPPLAHSVFTRRRKTAPSASLETN